MNVLYIEPGKAPRETEIDGSLASMQKLVGGSIEGFYPYNEQLCMVCNGEGKLNGMELNRAIYDEEGSMIEIMAGPFFICGLGEEDFASLPPDIMEKYKEQFKCPEDFISINGEIVALKHEPVADAGTEKPKPVKPAICHDAR